jgi:exopolysaccharide biosynthesis predicted pyruvyltransferase EpsI
MKSKRHNILFSTTRMWNVGDEFIYMGTKRLLEDAGINFNPILFNRHPTIFPNYTFRLKPTRPWRKAPVWTLPKLDNSFHLDASNVVDYVVIAGSPAWLDASSAKQCLEYAHKEGLRIAFLGIGSHHGEKLSQFMKDLLIKNADLIVTRDAQLYQELSELREDVVQMPCPALYSAPRDRVKLRSKVNRIGLVIQDTKTPAHDLKGTLKEEMMKLYSLLLKRDDTALIAHYIDDYLLARKSFPDSKVYYSSDSNDFIDIYDQFDFIVSPRVHGCGMAASLGIPSINLAHDARGSTTEGFLAKVVHADRVQNIEIPENVETWSNQIIGHRDSIYTEYLNLLKNIPLQ